MAAATVDNQFKTTAGPVLVEYIFITAPSSPDNPDTVISLLQNPSEVTIQTSNVDIGNTADPAGSVFNSTTARQVDLHDLTASRTYLVTVLGF